MNQNFRLENACLYEVREKHSSEPYVLGTAQIEPSLPEYESLDRMCLTTQCGCRLQRTR